MPRREQIVRFFLRQGCTVDDAEDLCQQVCLHLYQRGEDYIQLSPLHLFRVCRAVLIDHLRRRYRERALFVPLHEVADYPTCSTCVESAFLHECLDLLSAKQRRVVQMHIVQNMDFEEVAEALGCTPQSVRQLYHRAIARLRKHFRVREAGGYTVACLPFGG